MLPTVHLWGYSFWGRWVCGFFRHWSAIRTWDFIQWWSSSLDSELLLSIGNMRFSSKIKDAVPEREHVCETCRGVLTCAGAGQACWELRLLKSRCKSEQPKLGLCGSFPHPPSVVLAKPGLCAAVTVCLGCPCCLCQARALFCGSPGHLLDETLCHPFQNITWENIAYPWAICSWTRCRYANLWIQKSVPLPFWRTNQMWLSETSGEGLRKPPLVWQSGSPLYSHCIWHPQCVKSGNARCLDNRSALYFGRRS